MKLIVKQEEIFELEKKLLDIISNINSEFTMINNLRTTMVWEGIAHNIFINKYDDTLREEKIRIAKLEKLISFMDEILLNYGIAIDEIKNEYKDVLISDNKELTDEVDYE